MNKKVRFQARFTKEEIEVLDKYVQDHPVILNYKGCRSSAVEQLVLDFISKRHKTKGFAYQDFGCLFLERSHIVLSKELLSTCKEFIHLRPRLCSKLKKPGINDLLRTAIWFHEFTNRDLKG